jgi:GAF domain-containing protein
VGGLAQEDVDLLRSIASQVAIALQTARSFVETQRRAEREALIGTIGQKIRQTTSVDEALQVAVRELGRAVGAPQTRVRLTAEGGPAGTRTAPEENN